MACRLVGLCPRRPPSLELAAQVYDPRKLLAGSDYPYFQGDKYTRAFTYVEDTDFGAEQVRANLGANAAKLYAR